MMHFLYNTLIHLPLSGGFNGRTGKVSALRRILIFKTNSSRNSANQQVLNRIHGIGINAFHELEKPIAKEWQRIALIKLKWSDRRHGIAVINELAAIIF